METVKDIQQMHPVQTQKKGKHEVRNCRHSHPDNVTPTLVLTALPLERSNFYT
jgi:hypothetical protein